MEQSKSAIIDVYSMMSCLKNIEEKVGSTNWKTMGKPHEMYLELYSRGKSGIENIPEIKSIVDHDVSVVNKFLEDEGFDIKLPPLFNPEDFATASVLHIIVEWFQKGTEVKIQNNEEEYPGVEIEAIFSSAYKSENHDNPIISVDTKSKDKIYMTIHDNPFSIADPYRWIENLNLKSDPNKNGVVRFPMIDYKMESTFSYIEGLSIWDKEEMLYFIDTALGQVKFQMNEIGAKYDSAAAVGVSGCMEGTLTPPVIIDKPFLLWIERLGLELPICISYFAQDSWKKPERTN